MANANSKKPILKLALPSLSQNSQTISQTNSGKRNAIANIVSPTNSKGDLLEFWPSLKDGVKLIEYQHDKCLSKAINANVLLFKDYMAYFCKKPTIMVLTAWIWILFSCYDKLIYDPSLQGNSANAKFTKMIAYKEGSSPDEIFVKIQINPRSDDMIVDNINGFIMNEVAKKHGIQDFVMEYIDSCLSYIEIVGKDKGKDIYEFPFKTIMSKEGQADIVSRKRSFIICKFSFHRALKSKYNLAEYLNSLNVRHNAQVETFFRDVGRLFAVIKTLGLNYGFCHNDAHLGNILVNEVDDYRSNLVLIDYGRVYFTEELLKKALSKPLMSDIHKRLFHEIIKNTPSSFPDNCMKGAAGMSYRGFMKYTSNMRQTGIQEAVQAYIGPSLKDADTNFEFEHIMFMFDIMTVTLGICSKLVHQFMVKQVAVLQQEERDSMSTYSNFLRTFSNFLTFSNDGILFVRHPAETYIGFAKQNVQASVHPDMHFMIAGVFWFGLYIDFLWSKVFRDKVDYALSSTVADPVEFEGRKYFAVNLEALNKEGLIFQSFQLINLPHLDLFIQYCNGKTEIIKYFVDLLDTQPKPQSGGRVSLKKTSRKSKEKRDIKWSIRKGGKKHFAHMMGGYEMLMKPEREFQSMEYSETNNANNTYYTYDTNNANVSTQANSQQTSRKQQNASNTLLSNAKGTLQEILNLVARI